MKAVLAVLAAPVLLLGVGLGVVLFGDDDTATASGGTGVLNVDAVPQAYRDAVTRAATTCQAITGPVLAAQIDTESGWNPTAVSPAGAQGIAQFMPSTWATWGRDYDGDGKADPLDPTDAIGSEAAYMCSLADWADQQITAGTVTGDRLQLTLAAYNAGTARVLAAGGVPDIDETRAYVARILATIPTYTATSTADGAVSAGGGPGVSADGTYRIPTTGSGHLDPSTLCQIPWAAAGLVLRCDAETALAQLDTAYRSAWGVDLPISSAYRSYAAQVATRAAKGELAAIPGTSNHGWGLAVDFGPPVGTWGTAQRGWMAANAPRYGWSSPSWAQPTGSGPVEAWHFEFVGSGS